MYEIDLQNENNYPADQARLCEAMTAVLTRHSVHEATALSVVLTTDEAVRALNRQYRDTDSPTDILSFPADKPPVDIPGEPPYLGDLVIAFPYASAQAEREGHALNDSLALLVVHGTLHLLGYDHHDSESRAAMWAAQETILRELGIPVEILPALEGDTHGGSLEEDR